MPPHPPPLARGNDHSGFDPHRMRALLVHMLPSHAGKPGIARTAIHLGFYFDSAENGRRPAQKTRNGSCDAFHCMHARASVISRTTSGCVVCRRPGWSRRWISSQRRSKVVGSSLAECIVLVGTFSSEKMTSGKHESMVRITFCRYHRHTFRTVGVRG